MVVAGAVVGLACVALVSAATGGASKPSLALQTIGRLPASVETGGTITVTGTVRNLTGTLRVGRVTLSLRGSRASGSGRMIASKVLARVGGDRSARFTVVGAVPRSIPTGTYRVIVCVRGGGESASCMQVERRLRVTPSTARPEGAVFQTIDGFGSSSRVLTDPHVFDVNGPAPATSMAQQDEVLDALYRELRLTRIRPVQPDTAAGPPPVGIEVVNDNADPSVADLTRFTFAGRRLDDHAALVARAKARGASVAWISPLNREPWMGVSPGTDDVAEYAEWLLAQIRRFSSRGGRLDYVSIANEPSYSRNTMSGAFIREVIKNLGPRLEAEGLLVPFVVPDDVRASDAAAKAAVVLADPLARRYVGALATHLYDEPLERLASMRSLAERYDLPLWMSESAVGALNSMPARRSPATPLDWAMLMHELLARYDVSAIDYFWGYIGARDADQGSLLRLEHDGTRYRGFTRTKVFFFFGQYSRFIRPGALRIGVTSSNDSVRATAYQRGSARTIVVINPGSAPATTTLRAADLAGVNRLTRTRTSPTENWATPPSVSVTGTSVTVELPPHSVTTLTGARG